VPICLSQEAGGEEKACFKQPHQPAPQPPRPCHGQRSKPRFPALTLRSLVSSFFVQENPSKVHSPACPVEKPSLATAEYGKAAAWPGTELERLGRLGRGGCLPGGLPGRGTLAAGAPAAAKLPGKQGELRGTRRHRATAQQSEDPSLQVLTPAPCIAQQPIVLAQLLFLWCMDGAWLAKLFPSGYNAVNFASFPILCVSPDTTDMYLRNTIPETHLWHGYVCKPLCVSHRTLMDTETIKRNVFLDSDCFSFWAEWTLTGCLLLLYQTGANSLQ